MDAGVGLAQAVAQAESALFTGRRPELAVLTEALSGARHAASVTYVYGPPGVGKSSLLAVFTDAVRAARTPVVQAGALPSAPGVQALLDSLARETGVWGAAPASAGVEALGEALNRLASSGGLVLVVDDYDLLGTSERWVREQFLKRLGAGVCVVLAGRSAPPRLWPSDLGWRSLVRELRLDGFDRDQGERFLRRWGYEAPLVIDTLLALTCGRPRWLAPLADALAQRRGPDGVPVWVGGPSRDAAALVLEAVEQMLHPGSRRRAWRAGLGSSAIDRTLAAAVVLQRFNEADLAAAVGREAVQAAWPDLTQLPFVTEATGTHAVGEPARSALADVVGRRRPWSEYRWRQRVIARRVACAADDDPLTAEAASWWNVAYLARESPWYAALYPDAERRGGWVTSRGAGPADLPDLLRCRLDAWKERRQGAVEWRRHERWVRSRLEAHPAGFVLVRGAAGRLLAWSVSGPVARRRAGGARVAAARAGRRGWPERETAWLQIELGGLAWGVPAAAAGVLLRESLGEVGPCAGVELIAPAGRGDALGLGAVLPALGFVPAARACSEAPAGALEGGGRATAGTGPSSAGTSWTLAFRRAGYAGWLTRTLRPGRGPSPPGGPGAAAKEALEALDEPDRLAQTFAARFASARFGRRSPAALRGWLLDALDEAELDVGPVSGRTLLSLYYVERLGSHDAVAERLHISRPSYYRYHRRALDRLGACLFCLEA